MYSIVDLNSKCRIMSNDKIYSYNNDLISHFNSVQILASAQLSSNSIRNLTVLNSENGLKLFTNNITISYCEFLSSGVGLYLNAVENINIENCYFENNYTDDGSLYLDLVNNSTITNNVFKENKRSLKVKAVDKVTITYNNFLDNDYSFTSIDG